MTYDPEKWKDSVDPKKWQKMPPITALGLDALVGEKEIADISAEAMLNVELHEFTVDSECAPHFDILSIQVGRIQFVMGESIIPASTFSGAKCSECNLATVRRLIGGRWPSLRAGIPVILRVRNKSSTKRRFQAAFTCIETGER